MLSRGEAPCINHYETYPATAAKLDVISNKASFVHLLRGSGSGVSSGSGVNSGYSVKLPCAPCRGAHESTIKYNQVEVAMGNIFVCLVICQVEVAVYTDWVFWCIIPPSLAMESLPLSQSKIRGMCMSGFDLCWGCFVYDSSGA